MNAGERIKRLRSELGADGKKMTLDDFGHRLGVTKNAISNIENGKRNLTDQMCRAICNEFDVSYGWLKGDIPGDDVIFEKHPKDVAEKFAKENHLTNIEESLIREYLKMDDRSKEIFRNYVHSVMADLTAADRVDIIPAAASAPETTADQAEGDAPDAASKEDQIEKEIRAKLASYEAELRAEAASPKSGALPAEDESAAVNEF